MDTDSENKTTANTITTTPVSAGPGYNGVDYLIPCKADRELTAATMAAAGTITFARAAGGHVAFADGEDLTPGKIRVGVGPFVRVNDHNVNPDMGRADLKCAMLANVGTMFAGSVANFVADPTEKLGLRDTGVTLRLTYLADMELRQFCEALGLLDYEEDIWMEIWALTTRVVAENWAEVTGVATALDGGDYALRMSRCPPVPHPFAVTEEEADRLLERAGVLPPERM